jgi:molybdopterin molybdotransferase
MAQLTDDCFAFSGPLLPIADMERMIAERVQPVTETESVPLTAARGRVLAPDVSSRRSICRRSTTPPSMVTRCGHRDLDGKAETRLAIGGRLTAGSAAARRSPPARPSHLHRRADAAGADTVFMQEDVRAEGDAVIVPAGLKAGANRRLPARTCARDRSCCRPAGVSACRT